MAETDDRTHAIPTAAIPTQAHQCTAVIEELVGLTAESEWADLEQSVADVA